MPWTVAGERQGVARRRVQPAAERTPASALSGGHVDLAADDVGGRGRRALVRYLGELDPGGRAQLFAAQVAQRAVADRGPGDAGASPCGDHL
jgi:hypothetical protein